MAICERLEHLQLSVEKVLKYLTVLICWKDVSRWTLCRSVNYNYVGLSH
jgi:hypothetical protein